MPWRTWWDTTFFVELFILALVAPVVYFPTRFGPFLLYAALGLLALCWIWRRWRLGIWFARTPADWPIFFLFFVMLPISVWAAPEPWRSQYSWPKATVLIWNFSLFYTIVTHAGRNRKLFYFSIAGFIGVGIGIALLAPLGTSWLHKLPGSQALLGRMPSILDHLSREGPSGFHPNIVAGALLYVLPFTIGLAWALFFQHDRRHLFYLVLGCTLYMGGIFSLLQSRGGYIGFAIALFAMLLIHFRWGRRVLLAGMLAGLLVVPFAFSDIIQLISDIPAAAVGGTGTLEGFRIKLWTQAIYTIGDFPFTGSGLGAFQEVGLLLYPLDIPPSYYFGHAHNFWLQGAIDFGIPGLIAILALYLTTGTALYRFWQQTKSPLEQGITLGFFGALIAHLFFSLTDSIAMGTTPNLLYWYLFALILAVAVRSESDNLKTKIIDNENPNRFTEDSGAVR